MRTDSDVQQRLAKELETPPPKGVAGSMQLLFGRRLTTRALAERRIAAAMALARIGGAQGAFGALPHGEPEWVESRPASSDGRAGCWSNGAPGVRSAPSAPCYTGCSRDENLPKIDK